MMATIAGSTSVHAGDVSTGANNPAGVKDEALAAQEAKLRSDPLLRRFAESRRKLAADPYRPLYHLSLIHISEPTRPY